MILFWQEIMEVCFIMQKHEKQKTNSAYIKIDELPMTYLVMLDNSTSMKNNFQNMNSQLMDCLYIYQSILYNNDKLVVFPLNCETSSYIEISGQDDYRKSQEKLNTIHFFEAEENDSVEIWTQRVLKYLNHLTKTEARILVFTDKMEDELNPLETISLKRSNVRVITSSLYPAGKISNKLSVVRTQNADDLISNVFNALFYVHYYGCYSYEFSKKDDLINLQLPEPTDKLTILVSGIDASLSVPSNNSDEAFEGTILNDSLCLYRYRSIAEKETVTFFLKNSGIIYVLYPTSDGRKATILAEPSSDLLGDCAEIIVCIIIIFLIIWLEILLYKKFKKNKQQIFISYRREGSAILAHAIATELREKNYTLYLDTESLQGGNFDNKLLKAIERSSCVIAVIPPGGLDRCLLQQDDWVRKELSWAIYNNITIIPVLMSGFEWPKKLPLDIAALESCNAVLFNEQNYYKESMKKIMEFVEDILKKEY